MRRGRLESGVEIVQGLCKEGFWVHAARSLPTSRRQRMRRFVFQNSHCLTRPKECVGKGAVTVLDGLPVWDLLAPEALD